MTTTATHQSNHTPPPTRSAFAGWGETERSALIMGRQRNPQMAAKELAKLLNRDSSGPLAGRSLRTILLAVRQYDAAVAHYMAVIAEHGITAECSHGVVYQAYSRKIGPWVSLNGEIWTPVGRKLEPGEYLYVIDAFEYEPPDRVEADGRRFVNITPYPCRRSLAAMFAGLGSRFQAHRTLI